MSLPGKLCIGILEEDNPLKSYFRFKPLLVEEDGKYIPYEQHDSYPEDGCIRIVPDKNESYHFKNRMRRVGRFCVVDLREHPDENDKIRPNKNYHEGGPEVNAFIIYSDVVRQPAEGTIFEIIPTVQEGNVIDTPGTVSVLMRGESLGGEIYRCEAVEGLEGQVRLKATGEKCDLEALQLFEMPGFGDARLDFAVAPVVAAPVQEPPRPEPPRPEPPRPEPPAAEESAPAKPPEAPVPKEEKPWIHHDSSMMPSPPDPRMSRTERAMAAQVGLNPRKGRSLQELIDEKWAHSRLNQLGQPVSPITTGAPVASPVDSAVRAVREAWNQHELREGLLEALGGIEEFGASMQERREVVRQLDIEKDLQALEERRLALLGELDRLKAGSAEVRRQLKQEIRQEEDSDLAEALSRTAEAKKEQQRFQQEAEDARAAALDAQKAVEAIAGEQMEKQLREFVLSDRMLRRMRQLEGEAEPVPQPPVARKIALTELLNRITAHFEAEAVTLTRREALNLCACLAISPVMVLSGPVGSGKSSTARLLGEALGWKDAGRTAVFAPGKRSLEDDARIAALEALPNAPALLVLDDANLRPSGDMLRGLGTAHIHPSWRVIATVQDAHSGAPVPANVLDKGFVVRLNGGKDAPWGRRRRFADEELPMVSLLGAFEGKLPAPESAVPSATVNRMRQLRKRLGELGAQVSRRALEDAWNYCGVMQACLGDTADPAWILDMAVAQRLLPAMLASQPVEALKGLSAALEGMPVSQSLLSQPLPIWI